MSDSKVKTSPKGLSVDEDSSEKRGRGRPRKKTQESSGSPATKRARGRPKGSTKKCKTNKKPLNIKKSEGATARGRPNKKQEEEEGGTTESSEDQ